MKKVFLVLAVIALTVVSCKKAESTSEAPVVDSTTVQVDSIQEDSALVHPAQDAPATEEALPAK